MESKIQERTGRTFARFTPPLPRPFIKAVLSAFIKILTLAAYLLTKEHKHTRAGYIEKHWMLITSNYIKSYKKYIIRGPVVSSLLLDAVRLQLTTFCPDRLQPFEVCLSFRRFPKTSGSLFYKGDKNQKPFAFYKAVKNHNHFKNEGVFAALMVASVT